jgi:hypothetical protein
MTNNSDNKNIQFFIGNDNERNHIFEGASSSEKYVILSNEKLTVENKYLTEQLSKLNNEKDELEDENEKHDVSKRYIKGLLKNLVELERLHNDVKDKHKKAYVECRTNIYKLTPFKTHTEFQLYSNFIMSTFITLYSVLFYYDFYYDLLSFLCCVYLLFMFNLKIKTIVKNTSQINIDLCKDIKLDNINIEKIRNAQDFLDEYIENI